MRQLDADRLGDGQRVIEAGRTGAHVEPGVDGQQRAAVQARPGDRPVARLRGGRQCHEQQHASGQQESARTQRGQPPAAGQRRGRVRRTTDGVDDGHDLPDLVVRVAAR